MKIKEIKQSYNQYNCEHRTRNMFKDEKKFPHVTDDKNFQGLGD